MTVISLSVLALLVSTSIAAAGCEDSKSYFINEKPLPEKSDAQVDVAVQESAEGGEFNIYFSKTKKPERILRTDFGESGQTIVTLSIGAPNDILITQQKVIYSVPFTQPGSFVSRIETDYYFFCDGKLTQPPDFGPTSDYYKAAKSLADAMFKAPEIATFISSSKATPPVWP